MSQRTSELMLMLHQDGVDGEELKALVDSAFGDALAFVAEHYEPRAKGR